MIHESLKHLLAQHCLKAIYEHTDLKGLFGQGIKLLPIPVGSIVHQSEEIGKRDRLINTVK